MTLLFLIQIFLVFFSPPIRIHGKLLFLSDLFHLIITGVLWLWMFKSRSVLKRKAPSLGITGVILLMAYLQGFSRPDIRPYLHILEHPLDEGKRRIITETWTGIRFFSWISVGLILPTWFQSLKEQTQRSYLRASGYALIICTASCLFLMAGERWILGFSQTLTSFYIRDPATIPWWGSRTYGPFGSPLEAGLTLGLSLLLIYDHSLLSKTMIRFGVLVTTLGLLLTQTLTVIATLCILFTVRFLNQPLTRIRSLTMGSLICFLGGLGLYLLKPLWVLEKWGDLYFRFIPWRGYLNALMTFPRHLFFGFGFIPYYVDNSYLFILTRLGLIGTLGCCLVLKREIYFSLVKKEPLTVLFLLICGLFLDAWIIRPIVYLCLYLVLPSFNSKSDQSHPPTSV